MIDVGLVRETQVVHRHPEPFSVVAKTGPTVIGTARRSRELIVFAVVSVLVLVVVTVGALAGGAAVTRAEARRDAEYTADRLARVLVEPVADQLADGDPLRTAELAESLQARIDADIIRVAVLWRPDGSIAYSSGAMRGAPPTSFGDGLLEALAGRAHSEVVAGDDYGLRPADESLVEVYRPVRTTDGTPLVLEIYVGGDQLATRMSTMSMQLGVLAVLPVLLLTIVQFPIAVRLARRVGRHDRARARLLEHMLALSDRERRSIAADLHDGVVQDLAGAGYVLSGLTRAVPEEQRPLAGAAERAVLASVDQLRQLMIDINPPRLDGDGLRDAVRDVVERTAAHLPVDYVEGPLPDLGTEQAAALFRVAQEGLRNVVRHAGATTAWVELGTTVDGQARIAVCDNGLGIPASVVDEPPDGHLGLPLLRDRVRDLGGTFTVGARHGGGTELVALLPAVRAEDPAGG